MATDDRLNDRRPGGRQFDLLPNRIFRNLDDKPGHHCFDHELHPESSLGGFVDASDLSRGQYVETSRGCRRL